MKEIILGVIIGMLIYDGLLSVVGTAFIKLFTPLSKKTFKQRMEEKLKKQKDNDRD